MDLMAEAFKLQHAGRSIIHVAVGEPGAPTPRLAGPVSASCGELSQPPFTADASTSRISADPCQRPTTPLALQKILLALTRAFAHVQHQRSSGTPPAQAYESSLPVEADLKVGKPVGSQASNNVAAVTPCCVMIWSLAPTTDLR